MAAIILQFGYLNRQHLRGQSELLERLSEFLGQIPRPPCGVEIRNHTHLSRVRPPLLRDPQDPSFDFGDAPLIFGQRRVEVPLLVYARSFVEQLTDRVLL